MSKLKIMLCLEFVSRTKDPRTKVHPFRYFIFCINSLINFLTGVSFDFQGKVYQLLAHGRRFSLCTPLKLVAMI